VKRGNDLFPESHEEIINCMFVVARHVLSDLSLHK